MTDPITTHVRQTTYAARPGWVPSKLRHREFPAIDTPTVAVGSDGHRDKSGLVQAAAIVLTCLVILFVSGYLTLPRG